MKTNWEVQVIFYRTDNQNEVHATKRFENLDRNEIKILCEKNMNIFLKNYADVMKVECEATELAMHARGNAQFLSFNKKR